MGEGVPCAYRYTFKEQKKKRGEGENRVGFRVLSPAPFQRTPERGEPRSGSQKKNDCAGHYKPQLKNIRMRTPKPLVNRELHSVSFYSAPLVFLVCAQMHGFPPGVLSIASAFPSFVTRARATIRKNKKVTINHISNYTYAPPQLFLESVSPYNICH
jgi:hypothetical protein